MLTGFLFGHIWIILKILPRQIKNADCAAALRRAIKNGPPIWIEDLGLPIPESDTHIERLWFASDGKERSAVVTNALLGEEREKYWKDLLEYLVAMEIAEQAEKAKRESATAATD